MDTREKPADSGQPKQFLVKCNGCSFERTTAGREEVTQIGNDHRRETGHELVALEVPPSIGSS
ncbi:hypothetical protein [Natronoglomus mannanivorans]|uniref:Uncharacterized protein n=1 Tax=Natronoglomus mannanivorans TaxID=2979990 RepID=A0AAP3E0M3_9EURY|nr:hypothetical protein [Halobacteria archaeon AArc-xg1-1]